MPRRSSVRAEPPTLLNMRKPSKKYAKELLGLGVTVPGSAFDDVFCRILLGSLVCCVQVLLTGCTDATVPTATRPSTFDGSA